MSDSANGEGRAQAQPTSGAEWRQAREENERGFIKELWSGRVARLSAPDLGIMLGNGHIPDPLTALVQRIWYYGVDDKSRAELDRIRRLEELPRDELQHVLRLYATVCRAMFVEPKIVDDPQANDEISIRDVDLVDQAMCWEIARGGVRALESFRVDEIRSLAAVHGEQVDAEPADEPAAGGG